MNYVTALNIPDIRPIVFRWNFNLKKIGILGFIVFMSLLVFCIFQVNEVTKASFYIFSYQKQIAELGRESKSLETNFSQVNSLVNLEILLDKYNYEEVGKVHYIKVPGVTVVAK